MGLFSRQDDEEKPKWQQALGGIASGGGLLGGLSTGGLFGGLGIDLIKHLINKDDEEDDNGIIRARQNG